MSELEKPGLYHGFENWLSSPRAPDGDVNAMLLDIRDNLLPHFQYNQFDIARNPDRRMRFDARGGILYILDDPLRKNLAVNCGNCIDLATKAYLLICQKYPALRKHLVLFDVKEKRYFKDGSHKVLVYADDVLIDGVSMVDFEEEYSNGKRIFINGRGSIIDPTFGRCGFLFGKGYELFCPVPMNLNGDIPLDALEPSLGIAIPLAITRKKIHVFFDVYVDGKEVLVGFEKPRRKVKFHRYDDPVINETLSEDPEIMENIRALSSAIKAKIRLTSGAPLERGAR